MALPLRRTLRRFARRAAAFVAAFAAFALLVFCGLLAYLHTASGRRFLAAKVSAWVSREIVAELRIERIDVLSSNRLVISRATVFDAKGRAVLSVRGLRAPLDAWTLLHNALEPTARVELPNVQVEQLEVGLYRTESGGISLADAFDSASPAKPTTPPRAAKGPRIHLPKVAVARVTARSDFGDLSRATAELRTLNLTLDLSPELFSLGFKTADARVSGMPPLDARGRLQAELRFPGITEADFHGAVGALPLRASFRANGPNLGLTLDAESLAPEALRGLIPSWPLVVPLSARVELSGPATALAARVDAHAGASRLDGTGSVALSPTLKGEIALTGHDLDVRVLAATLSPTALGVDAKLEFASEPALHVALNAHSARADVLGVALPETNWVAVYADNQLSGTATSVDPALPVTVNVRVTSEGALNFHAVAQDLDLGALAPYGLDVRGHADLDVSGELRAAELVARFEARVRAFQRAPVLAQSTLVRGRLRGPIAHPDQLALEIEAQGTKLSLGAAEFSVWALESRGSPQRQIVSARAGPESAPTLQASTTLAFGQGVSLSETRLEAELNGVKHDVALKFARFADQRWELNELHWQAGTGTLAGSLLLTPSHKLAEFELSGLQSEVVSKTLGVDTKALRGQLGARLHFEEDGQGRRGELKASLVNGTVAPIGGVQAELLLHVTNSEVEGEGTLVAPQLGRGNLSVRGTLGQAPLGWEFPARGVGELKLDLHDLDLTEASRRLLPNVRVAVSGFLDASVRLAKSDPGAPAALSYDLKTRDLGLRSRQSESEGSLLHGEISSHGEVGASQSAFQVDLKDAAGPWISAKIEHGVGLVEFMRALRSASAARLSSAPLHAQVEARPRSLELLGGVVPRALRGEVAANVGVTGTLLRPEIAGSLAATGLGGVGVDPSGRLLLNIDYSSAREEYALAAHYADRTRAKLDVSGGGHLPWLDGGFGQDWSARGEAKIENIELGPFGELLAVPLTGTTRGSIALSASPNDFEATGQLDLDRLTLERHSLGTGRVQLRVHRGLAQAKLEVTGADSTLEVSGETGLVWANGPRIDAERGGSLDAKVRNYQLATLAPLLHSVASDVRGPVNGFVTIAWDAADGTGKRKTRLRADAVVDGGSVILSAGAGSFQCAKLRALGDDTNVLKLTVSACARSSRTNLWANADVAWNGLLPERVTALLYTKDPAGKKKAEGQGGKLPVTFDGVVLGSATVSKAMPIRVVVDLAGTRRAIEANIPALEFELPVKDDTSLVDLTDDPAIVITDAKLPPELAGELSESTPWKISVQLGNAVVITQPGMRVAGAATFSVPVTGSLTQSPDGLLDGEIVLPEGGTVPQLGQIFRLKRGKVRFSHQALNDGALNIEASTRTAEGVVVELYVSGTIEKPVIRLRSDPPRSENDIVALLLGVQGSDSVNSNGQKGADLRGSATALAMNQLLRGSALAAFQFGAGQTHQGDSVSTVSMRASNTVWLEGRTVRSSTQRAQSSGVQSSGVIDWRFARGFSLRTQLGNISGLELRWSHRY